MEWRRRLPLVLVVNTAGAVIPTCLSFAMQPGTTLHTAWHDFQYSLVYSYCIGSLAFATLNPLFRYLFQLARAVRYLVFGLSLVLVAIAGSLLANLIFVALTWQSRFDWSAYQRSLRTAIFITILIGTAVSVYEVMKKRLEAMTLELRTREMEEQRARQLAAEARLSSLESRIHPHFLFNTLNSISALIREDPRTAERTVERLAALLRYSLDNHARGLVPLRQEVQVVRDYLEIESTRFGVRLRYSIDVPDELLDREVPPLAAQCLVENSIKHAVSASRQGGEVRISARTDDGRLVLEVSDDGAGFELKDARRGHGLENLQERIAALFDGKGRLEVRRQDGRTIAALVLPAGSAV